MKDTSLIVSTSYDKNLSNTYSMSIQFNLDGLYFSVFDPIGNEFIALGENRFDKADDTFSQHEEILLTKEIFRQHYQSVLVSVESRSFSLIPKGLYDPEQADKVLKFIGCNIISSDKVMADEIEKANAVNVYTIPNFLYYFLQTQFNNVKLTHYTTPIIRTALTKRSESFQKSIMHVVFSNDGITIIATEQNMLKLCNKYKYTKPTDVVYIVMYTIEQMGLNNINTRIIISGDIETNSETAVLLRRFAQNVEFGKIPPYFEYGIKVPNTEHKYVNLFNMALCV